MQRLVFNSNIFVNPCAIDSNFDSTLTETQSLNLNPIPHAALDICVSLPMQHAQDVPSKMHGARGNLAGTIEVNHMEAQLLVRWQCFT